MKRIYTILSIVVGTISIVCLLSFTVRQYNPNGFYVQCFYYANTASVPNPVGHQLLEFEHWNSAPVSEPPPECTNVPRLCAICFNTTTISFYQAREALATYIGTQNFQSVISSQATVIPIPESSETVTIYLKPIS